MVNRLVKRAEEVHSPQVLTFSNEWKVGSFFKGNCERKMVVVTDNKNSAEHCISAMAFHGTLQTSQSIIFSNRCCDDLLDNLPRILQAVVLKVLMKGVCR